MLIFIVSLVHFLFSGYLNGLLSHCMTIHGLMHVPSSGSPDGAVLLCLGVSIGVISSFIANRKEVDKLKNVLKQTESLVEDLQEELEMKDSVMVKELANENYGSQDTCDNLVFNRALNPFSPEQNIDKYDGRGSYEQKAEESSESMRKIEAELEAELERLGLNMNTSTLERRLTDLDEVRNLFIFAIFKFKQHGFIILFYIRSVFNRFNPAV